MKIIINGQEQDCAPGTLADLWREQTRETGASGPQGYAMALNGSVVRQAEWPATPLNDGDRIEIVRAMQGG